MTARKTFITKMVIAFSISFMLMLWAISTANAMQASGDDPYRTEEFSMNAPGDLEVRTSGGHITVEGSNDDRIRVEMYVSKNGENLLPSDTNLDEFEIEIRQEGDRVIASAKRENSNNWKFWENNNTSVSFKVFTPRQTSTNLKTSGGHIKTSGLAGNQQIATSGGHLDLSDLEGRIQARTSGGHIELANVSGEVEARTSGGHISAQNTKGSLMVRTSGGHIDLENIAGTVEAATSGGRISAGITEMGEFARLRTSGGNVDITVPRNIGLNLDLHGSRVRTQLDNFSGSMEDDDVKGTLNGGGPELAARTSGGTVRLSFR